MTGSPAFSPASAMLRDVPRTEKLALLNDRPPEYEAESRAPVSLAPTLAEISSLPLQTLTDIALNMPYDYTVALRAVLR